METREMCFFANVASKNISLTADEEKEAEYKR